MNEFSKGQQLYLRRLRRHHRIVIISRVLILILFLLLWEITANTGLIDSFIFSSPSRVAECFWEMVIDKTIFLHIGVTLYEIIVSFLLVTFFSILIAVILWYSRKLSEILDPYLVVLNSLPKSALAPLLIVWLGANETTIIVAGMSVAIFGSILNLYTSFTSIDEEKIKLIYTLRKAHRTGAKFMMNNNSLFAIRLLKDSEGNYLWRPGLELGQPSSLAGYGIAENEQMPDIAADAKAIAFW